MSLLPTATDELIEFITDLRRNGFNIDTEQYVSAHRLLCALVSQADWLSEPLKFGRLLSPILCSSPEEQNSYLAHYERWLSTQPAIFNLDTEGVTPSQPTPRTDSKHLFSISQYVQIVGVVLGIFIAIVAIILFMRSGIRLPAQNQANDGGGGGQTSLTGLLGWITLFVGGGLVTLVVLVWLPRLRRRLELKKLRTRAGQPVATLIVKGASDQLIRFLPVRRIAQEMRRYQPVEVTDLDVPKTVEESIRAGMFKPTFTARKALPEYLVLIERSTFADQQARLTTDIVDRLRSHDVPIEHYFFSEDPRLCWKDGPKAQFQTLEELAVSHPDDRLLVFSSTNGFFNSLTGRPHRWLETFSNWPARLLLTSEVQAGDYHEWVLSKLGFRVLPASSAGLIAITESLDGGTYRVKKNIAQEVSLPVALRERAGHWLKSYPPPPEVVNELCDELKAFLGYEGYFWLSACAVYPSLYFDLTFYLGFRLVDHKDLFDTYSRLVRLPWFRSGIMPEWLRARLIIELDPKREQTIRTALNDLLIGSLKQPDGFVLPVVTAAQSAGSIAGWSWLKAKTRAMYKTKLAEDILRAQLDEEGLRDYVALSFMSGRKPSRLAVTLPEELYPALHPSDGPVIDGLMRWTILITNFFLSSFALMPVLTGKPLAIVASIAVWIGLMGLTLWSVRVLSTSGPFRRSAAQVANISRESSRTSTNLGIRLIAWLSIVWLEIKEKILKILPQMTADDASTGLNQSLTEQRVGATAEPNVAAEPEKFSFKIKKVLIPHQLRAPLEDFVGRDKEITELLKVLRGGDSAVITGIGGIGKTELALMVAHRLIDDYPDGQILINLEGTIGDPQVTAASAMRECIGALAVFEQQLPSDLGQLTKIYQAILSGKRVLILVENPFHEDQLRHLIPPTGSSLLITSRNYIGKIASTTSLTGLSRSDARELLKNIAPQLSDEIADELCSLCDYSPLVLRMSGSLLASTGIDPSRYLAQLRDERLQYEIESVDEKLSAPIDFASRASSSMDLGKLQESRTKDLVRRAYSFASLAEYSFRERLLIRMSDLTFFLLINLIGLTLRWIVIGNEHLDSISSEGRLPIHTFWHNRIFSATYFLRNRRIVIMTSRSFDGEYVARFFQRFGFGAVRGSSIRGGVSGLVSLARLMRADCPAGFTIDGPKGPRYVAKMGAVLLSKKTGNPILPFSITPARRWIVPSWDHFQIPRPFTRVMVEFAQPIYVPNDADEEILEAKRSKLQQVLDEITGRGEEWRETDGNTLRKGKTVSK